MKKLALLIVLAGCSNLAPLRKAGEYEIAAAGFINACTAQVGTDRPCMAFPASPPAQVTPIDPSTLGALIGAAKDLSGFLSPAVAGKELVR